LGGGEVGMASPQERIDVEGSVYAWGTEEDGWEDDGKQIEEETPEGPGK